MQSDKSQLGAQISIKGRGDNEVLKQSVTASPPPANTFRSSLDAFSGRCVLNRRDGA